MIVGLIYLIVTLGTIYLGVRVYLNLTKNLEVRERMDIIRSSKNLNSEIEEFREEYGSEDKNKEVQNFVEGKRRRKSEK